MTIIITYGTAAVLLFGREMKEYSTIDRALISMLLVILGEFEWEDMREVGRGVAGVWFVTFNFLVVIIMLNMLLSIVMDTYMEVKGQTGGAETLISQARETFRRYRQR